MSTNSKSETETMLEAGRQQFHPKMESVDVFAEPEAEKVDTVEDTEPEVEEKENTEPEVEVKEGELPDNEKEAEKPKETEVDKLKAELTAWEAKDEEYKAKIKELEDYREETKKANKAIVEAFQAEPVVAEMMKDIVQGLTIRQAINKYFDPTDLTVEEGDPDEEEIKKVVVERKKAEKEREDYFKAIDDNKKVSEKSVNEFVKEHELKEEEAAEFFNKVDKFLIDAYNGKLTKELFTIIKKGLEFDEKVEIERKAAEIKARNEKIEIEKEKRKTDGDGLPKITKKSEVKEEPPKPKPTGFLKALGDYEKRNIF